VGSILQELKKDALRQIAQNLPALIAGGAALAGGAVNRLPIPGPVGKLVKTGLRGVVALLATTLTRMSASPATPASSAIQARLQQLAGA
jgi:hypothetical protein